jgi:hypothetical protein
LFDVQPGKPGGQSALSAHFVGGRAPGNCGAGPLMAFLITTLWGVLRVPLIATTSPAASVA